MTNRKVMAKKWDARFDARAKEEVELILEGYHKGGHTCRECGKVSVWLSGCVEFRDKVKSLLSKELPGFEEGGIYDGYCPDCWWAKRGIGLDVNVIVHAPREKGESPGQIAERVKSQLGGLGLSFTIGNVERVHCRTEKGW